MKMSKKTKDTKFPQNRLSIFYLIPFIIIIAVIPLVVHGKVIELPLDEADFWKGGILHFDFYHYYKSIALIIILPINLILFSSLILNKKIIIRNEKKYYIPMIIFVILAIISSVLSYSKHVSLVGFIGMYQGIFVLLSYISTTFILINYINDEKHIKILIYSFVALIIVEGLLGVGEYFGLDFHQSALGNWLITPSSMKDLNLKFTSGKYSIYGTLYNSNFVGSFGALVLPLSIGLYLSTKERNKSIIFGITALLAYSLWLGCNSRAGYLGITTASVIGIIIFRKIIKLQYKKIVFLLLSFVIILTVFNTVSNGRVLNQFIRLNPMTEVEKLETVKENQLIKFKELSVKDNTFTVKTDKETLIGIYDNENLRFTDESGKELSYNIDNEDNITFTDEKYSGYKFYVPSANPSQINAEIHNRKWDLYLNSENNIKVISFNNKLTEPIEAPRMNLFDGRETFASNRGYIWSRTIPMLKDSIFIGYGPDNFTMVFPQEDYIGRFNTGTTGMTNMVIDKPHNMYLQTAVNTGVISLLALLFMWAFYLFDCVKLYIKGNMNSFTEYIGAAIFISIMAYLVAGLFNDSVVSVAPLFWVLLGMGIAINRTIKCNKGYSVY